MWQDIQRIRSEAPLVHNITNYVVMNSTANVLLAAGASPVMAHAAEEVEDMVTLSRALVLNIGTLSTPWLKAMIKAGKRARRKGIPIVFDPVGSGATRMRTDAAGRIIGEVSPTIIRGNASEIASLAGVHLGTKGVDTTLSSEEAVDMAMDISRLRSCVVVVSGATDIIVGDAVVTRVLNGHPMMTSVTGMGCSATALIGAFAAVNPVPIKAAAHAMALMGIAGEMAAEEAAGPGSFQMRFLDALYRIKEADVLKRLRMDNA